MKKAAVIFIIFFWLAMTTFFVRREIWPIFFSAPPPDYSALRRYAESHSGYSMGVFDPNGTRIGTVDTTYNIKADGLFEIASRGVISFEKHALATLGVVPKNLAESMRLELWSDIEVNPDNTLKSFRVICEGVFSAYAIGLVRGKILYLSVTIENMKTDRAIPIESDDVVSNGFMVMGAMPNIRPGQSWQFKTLDPMSFELRTGLARVVKRAKVQLRGAWYDTFLVELKQGQMTAMAWVDSSGQVLKQEAFQVSMVLEPLPHEVKGPALDQLTPETIERP